VYLFAPRPTGRLTLNGSWQHTGRRAIDQANSNSRADLRVIGRREFCHQEWPYAPHRGSNLADSDASRGRPAQQHCCCRQFSMLPTRITVPSCLARFCRVRHLSLLTPHSRPELSRLSSMGRPPEYFRSRRFAGSSAARRPEEQRAAVLRREFDGGWVDFGAFQIGPFWKRVAREPNDE